jgi:hypothetical protein
LAVAKSGHSRVIQPSIYEDLAQIGGLDRFVEVQLPNCAAREVDSHLERFASRGGGIDHCQQAGRDDQQ